LFVWRTSIMLLDACAISQLKGTQEAMNYFLARPGEQTHCIFLCALTPLIINASWASRYVGSWWRNLLIDITAPTSVWPNQRTKVWKYVKWKYET
jgi:hypothetical protein